MILILVDDGKRENNEPKARVFIDIVKAKGSTVLLVNEDEVNSVDSRLLHDENGSEVSLANLARHLGRKVNELLLVRTKEVEGNIGVLIDLRWGVQTGFGFEIARHVNPNLVKGKRVGFFSFTDIGSDAVQKLHAVNSLLGIEAQLFSRSVGGFEAIFGYFGI